MFKGIWILNEVMYFIKNSLHAMQIYQKECFLIWILNTTPISAVFFYLHMRFFLKQRSAHAKPIGHKASAHIYKQLLWTVVRTVSTSKYLVTGGLEQRCQLTGCPSSPGSPLSPGPPGGPAGPRSPTRP